jgi:tetratricopeptide (TPR) repeat protein
VSGEALYERYKDALRRGHVASLRGRLEDALAAYAEAASIAPERSTPHTSTGTALLRSKRPADALQHYATALRLSARDDAALLGRAQALAALDRRPEAANAFDTLAESRAAADKLADAVNAARLGLELAEGRDRRRTLERLIDRLRASEPGEPGRIALEQALLVLEGHAMAPVTPGQVGSAGGRAPSTQGTPRVGPQDDASEIEIEPPAPEPPMAVAYRRALDRDLDPGTDAAALALLAEDALGAEDREQALERLLDLAAAYRRDGHIDGALDACYLALSLGPDDTGLHLALVELYDERGWSALAAEKLDLVAALVDLDGGEGAIGRVAAARSDRG